MSVLQVRLLAIILVHITACITNFTTSISPVFGVFWWQRYFFVFQL